MLRVFLVILIFVLSAYSSGCSWSTDYDKFYYVGFPIPWTCFEKSPAGSYIDSPMYPVGFFLDPFITFLLLGTIYGLCAIALSLAFPGSDEIGLKKRG